MNPGAQSPSSGFEAKNFKNSTPNEISELSRTAYHVMKMAVYNAENGLNAQLSRSQPAAPRMFNPVYNGYNGSETASAYPRPVRAADAAPVQQFQVVDTAAYHKNNANAAVQPAEVATVPVQPTILDDGDYDPDKIRNRIDAIYAEHAAEQQQEDYPYAA